MQKELRIPARAENIGGAAEFMEKALRECGIERKTLVRSTVAAEELLALLVQHAPNPETEIRLRVRQKKQRAKIQLSCRGSEFTLEDTESAELGVEMEGMDDEQQAAIRGLLLREFSGAIQIKHTRGINHAEVYADEKTRRSSNTTLLCMALGIVLGVVLRAVLPAAAAGWLSVNIFSLVSNLFMNAIKMVVAPLVFFSIAESMTGFADMRSFGRIGGKVMGLYLFTSVAAFWIGILMTTIFRPGDPALRDAVTAMAGSSDFQAVSTKTISDIVTGIVPSNLVGAFLNADMLQIIFLGIMVGFASGMLGEHTEGVQRFLRAGNALFLRVTDIIVRVLPAAALCAMANLVLNVEMSALLELVRMFVTMMCSLACMIGCYSMMMVVLGRRNPFPFLYKIRRAVLTAASTMSGSATMPVNMECLRDMGVSSKIYSFSVPLGATINMDGCCVDYGVVVLFMMRVFGIPLTAGSLLVLFLNVLLISVASPSVPGGTIAMMALLFSQFGIPVGAVSFVIGYETMVDMFLTASNVVGDAAVSAIVAASEGLLDDEKYAA